jgi:hypothetical protein
VNVYFINCRGYLRKALLRLLELLNRHGGKEVAAYILSIAVNYSIKKWIGSVATNNASIIDNAYK